MNCFIGITPKSIIRIILKTTFFTKVNLYIYVKINCIIDTTTKKITPYIAINPIQARSLSVFSFIKIFLIDFYFILKPKPNS